MNETVSGKGNNSDDYYGYYKRKEKNYVRYETIDIRVS